MTYLLDTNVISEWVKPRPDPGVVAWLAEIDEDRSFISVISMTELRYGIERLPTGRRRNRLARWLGHDMALRFEGRVLSIDAAVADDAGRILTRRDDLGRSIGIADAFIAATAMTYGLTLVTRDIADFEPSAIPLFSPWQDK